MNITTSINQEILNRAQSVASVADDSRLHQLDWLRVFAFGLLVLYHTAMVFVANWGFHYKSQHQSVDLQYLMLVVEPWRMACLWFVSGVALQMSFSRYSTINLLLKRSFQLLLPLLVGVLIVVPPQLYVEMSANGDLDVSFIEFLRHFYSSDSTIFDKYQAGIWPHIDVNHLWYLRSLWKYSLILIIVAPLINNKWLISRFNSILSSKPAIAILLCYLPLLWLQFYLDGEDKRYVSGFLFLLYGFIAAKQPTLWLQLCKHLKIISLMTITNLVLMMLFYKFTFATSNQTPDTDWLWALRICYSLAKLLGLILMLSIATRFFGKRSQLVTKLNPAVYPCYILHQTYIVVFGWLLSVYTMDGMSMFFLIVLCTMTACALSIWIIQRFNVLRLCFGMPTTKPIPKIMTWIFYPVAIIGCIVIGLEILL
ncbi:acyltransferase family protein [Thalassotalea fusca]